MTAHESEIPGDFVEKKIQILCAPVSEILI